MEREELLELQEKVMEYGKSLNHFETLLKNQAGEMDEDQKEQEETLDREFLLLQRRFNDLQDLVINGFEIEMHQRFDELEEKTHTDCIKVYRNVQAVIVEELSKQNKVIMRDDKIVTGMKRKMTTVFIFSIISVVTSVALIILQILPLFGIKLI